MQAPEMRALYTLHHHKRLLNLIKSNLLANPNASIPKSAQIGCFPPRYSSLGRRRVHSSTRLSSNVGDPDENPRVWASFDPVSNDVVTRVVGEGELDGGDEKVATLSSLGSFDEGLGTEEGELDGGDEKVATLSSLGSFDEGLGTEEGELDGGDEKVATLSSLGSFVEGLGTGEGGSDGDGVSRKSWASVYKKRNGGAELSDKSGMTRGVVGESKSFRGINEGKESEEERAEVIPKSWANVYSKRSAGAGPGTESTTSAVGESVGSFGEDSVQEREDDADEKFEEDKSVNNNSVDNLSPGIFISKKKKAKTKTSWVCSSCGTTFGQWWGSCKVCGGEIKQFSEPQNVDSKPNGFNVTDKVVGTWLLQKPGELLPQRLTDVNKGINQLTWRIPLSGLFGAEVSRVLGGGLVPGCLVLVGGDPGVGKSTLLLQIAAMIAEEHVSGQPAPVVYVSGEESVEQIANRADRMRIGTNDLFLYSGTDIEDILEKIHVLSPRALIVDSIQTVYLKGVAGSAGGIVQVKECTQSLLQFAKKTNIPVLLIGHVTKTGELAGPRVLEHIVDVVLYMEGEKYSAHRFLRSVKNRFGSTDELGVFEMSQGGLQAVLNPSDIFLSEQHSDSENLVGLAVAVIIDGSRSFLLEIQALCLPDASVPRQFNGVQQSRAQMIISVLIKQAGLMLQNNAIFVNVVSGVKLQETAGDLAIAAAICSSCLEFPIPNDVAFIGEIGLGGELHPVPRMEKRVNAVAKLGYRKCIVPKSAEKQLTTVDFSGMMIQGCENLKEMINIVFKS